MRLMLARRKLKSRVHQKYFAQPRTKFWLLILWRVSYCEKNAWMTTLPGAVLPSPTRNCATSPVHCG
jgi:hypothetical protein